MDFEYYEYKVFPVSERILTWNEDPANGGRGTCITPFDQYKIGSYRKDPNYDNQNGGLDYMVISNDVAIVNDSGESQYCLEILRPVFIIFINILRKYY